MLQAQEQPKILQNAGKPMRVPVQCTDDDIQWAGLTCSEEEPCPVYLELSAVEAVGNKLFLIGNIHSSTTTLYSLLLTSDDAGKTWREPHSRMRGTGFDHIQFLDFETGWISGQQLQPLPRDPFLLATADGGKTWRELPIFSESRVGAIQQFRFDSRKTGSLVIDRLQSGEAARYERYETPSGGESWMIREASERPIRLRGLDSLASADWRLHADAGSKSFRVEKRQGERWAVIASFLVPVGQCKPEAPKLAEPPPEQPSETPAAPPAPPPAPAPRSKPPTLRRPPQ